MTGYRLRKRCAEVRFFVVITLSRLLTAIQLNLEFISLNRLNFISNTERVRLFTKFHRCSDSFQQFSSALSSSLRQQIQRFNTTIELRGLIVKAAWHKLNWIKAILHSKTQEIYLSFGVTENESTSGERSWDLQGRRRKLQSLSR